MKYLLHIIYRICSFNNPNEGESQVEASASGNNEQTEEQPAA